MSAKADCVAPFAGYGRRVHVCCDVAEIWSTHRQRSVDAPESFGVLVGTTSLDRKEVWIEAATTPKPLDKGWRFGFEMRDPGHARVVQAMHQRSQKTCIYLGTWHTHAERTPSPSPADRRDWRVCLRRNPRRPLVFVIVGTERTRLFVPERRAFRALNGA